MSVNGKSDGFSADDLKIPAQQYGIKNANSIIQDVADAVALWPVFANNAGVAHDLMAEIKRSHRLDIVPH
jgi:serine/threonine-protein kinase HipA